MLDVVKADKGRRETEALDAQARKDALRDRIRGQQDDEGGDDGEEEPEVDADGNPVVPAEVDENGDPVVPAEADLEPAGASEGAPVAVAAGAVPTPDMGHISRVAVRRPANRAPRKTSANTSQAAITAAAGLPGHGAGQVLKSDNDVFAAFDAAVRFAQATPPDQALNQPIISLRSEIPEELQLGRDPILNDRKIEARSGTRAIVAAGGACAPVPYRYDLPTVGDVNQPVRDEASVRYGAQRAGINLFIPPTLVDVQGTGATTSAFSEWTYANDVNPTSPTTKPYLRIDCGNNTPQVTRVNAIVTQYESGNMLERWYPELIKAYTDLIAVGAARFSEAKRLAAIAAGSKIVSHGQILGSASDIFPALDQLIDGIEYRHRITSPNPIRVIGFDWVRGSIVTDLIRRGAGEGRSLEERLAMVEGAIDAWFRARNCNITWSPDFQFGVALGSPGGPMAGVQNAGPVIGRPSIARFYVFMEGSWLYLDGGEFRVGVLRDVTKVRTNDWVFFSEYFENMAYHGVPGESYCYDIDICANGGYSSPLDINPCVTNS
jgi:hypothetical protein